MALNPGSYVICDMASLQETYGRQVEAAMDNDSYFENKEFACVLLDDEELIQLNDNYQNNYILRSGIFGIFPSHWVDESEIFYVDFESANAIIVEYTGSHFCIDDLVVTIYNDDDSELLNDYDDDEEEF